MRKTLLSMFAIGLAAMPFQSNAITVDDLDGKGIAYIHNGTDCQFGAPVWHSGGYLKKNANGGLDIVGFMSDYIVPCTLSNNKLTINCTGTFKSINGDKPALKIMDADGDATQLRLNGQYVYSNIYDQYTTASITSNAYESVEDSNGFSGYRFRFSGIYSLQITGYIPEFPGYIDIFVYDTNATAKMYQNGNVVKTYNVAIEEDGNNLTIKNYFNMGAHFHNTFGSTSLQSSVRNWVYGTVDDNGNCTLNWDYMGGSVLATAYGYQTNIRDRYGNYWEGWMFSRANITTYHTYLASDYDSSSSPKFKNITGKRINAGKLSHRKHEVNRWSVNDGGAVTTHQLESIYKFGQSRRYSTLTGTYTDHVDSIVITANNGGDCTHDVKMQINEFDFNPRNGHLKTTVTTHSHKNFDNVDYYDLYIVPGTYTSAADAGFKHHFEKGHEDAALVKAGCIDTAMEDGEIITNYITVAPHTNDALKGLGLEDVAALDDDPEPVKKPYTLFLKAHYKPETGLEPTFHALATQLTTTGLEDLEAKSEEAAISAATGMIVIDGSDAVAEVYTTSGALVYAGADREIAVPAGLYIVRVGNQTAKVVVK